MAGTLSAMVDLVDINNTTQDIFEVDKNRSIDIILHTKDSSSLNNKTNTTVSSEEIIVDFREYYKYGFELLLYGYFMPVWASLCIIMYTLMIVVFIRHGMTTKTHVCLIAIAVCDSLSPIAPTATWMYFFAIKNHYFFLPFEWCQIYHYTTEVIPQLFTYTSYFITIMMTVHRYIIVAHPFKAEKLCSMKTICVMIVACFLSSVAIRLVHFFHYDYRSITVQSKENVNKTMEACAYVRPDWLPISLFDYLGILMIAQTVVVGIIPCTLLVVSELLMLKAINTRSAKRQNMTSNSKMQTKNARNERRLTVATIFITAVTLFYMVPVVVIQVIDVVILIFKVNVGDYNDLRTAVVIMNVVYWMCIPSNFLITCCLSHEFRSGIRRLFVKTETAYTSHMSTISVARTKEVDSDHNTVTEIVENLA